MYAYIEHDIKLENEIPHGMKEVPRAVEMLKNGGYRGKACIVVDEDTPGLHPDSSRT